jgi:hypothetical protein
VHLRTAQGEVSAGSKTEGGAGVLARMGLTGLKNIEKMSRAISVRLLAWLRTQTGLHLVQVLQVGHEAWAALRSLTAR